MKLSSLIIPLIILLAVACNKKADENTSGNIEEKPSETIVIKENTFTSFKGFPSKIEGCSCYFGEDSNAVINKNFYFVASYDSIAFIAYNEKKIKMKLIESIRTMTEYGDTDQKNIYTNDSLNLEISWKFQNKTGYESWWNKADMKVLSNGEQLFHKELVGECGC